MLDRSAFWSVPPVAGLTLTGPEITAQLLPALPQVMISGNLDQALADRGLDRTSGLLETVSGECFAIRLARQRMLVIGERIEVGGWRNDYALSPMTGSLAVFNFTGPRAMEIVGRGTAINPASNSPCAALNFAGITAVLYRHQASIRLHFDRGLIGYMADWLAATDLFGDQTSAKDRP